MDQRESLKSFQTRGRQIQTESCLAQRSLSNTSIMISHKASLTHSSLGVKGALGIVGSLQCSCHLRQAVVDVVVSKLLDLALHSTRFDSMFANDKAM